MSIVRIHSFIHSSIPHRHMLQSAQEVDNVTQHTTPQHPHTAVHTHHKILQAPAQNTIIKHCYIKILHNFHNILQLSKRNDDIKTS